MRCETKTPNGTTETGKPIGRPCLNRVGSLVPGTDGEFSITTRQLGAQ